MSLRVGSLFAGYGGLEMGLASVIDCEAAWFSELDPAPSRVLAHHWPEVPNLGDITAVDWATVEPVDILCGGFPCQDVSLAGLRKGLHPGTRSGLWSHFALAIDALRPPYVIVENVRGLLSAQAASNLEPDAWGLGNASVRPPLRALGAVLGDLADLGYDTQWAGIRAADAGAPHGRFRVFLLARPTDTNRGDSARRLDDPIGQPIGRTAPPRPRLDAAEDADIATRDQRGIAAPGQAPTGRTRPDTRRRGGAPAWGSYEPAIRRWELATGRLAPNPTETSTLGGQRLSPRFVEWLMGLPAGHVTDPAIGLTRNEQLKALGNGVVPQQAALALRTLLGATAPEPIRENA